MIKEMLQIFPKKDVKIVNEYENRELVYFIKLKRFIQYLFRKI